MNLYLPYTLSAHTTNNMPRLSSEKFYETLDNLSGTDNFDDLKQQQRNPRVDRFKSRLKKFNGLYKKKSVSPQPDNLYELYLNKPTFRVLNIHAHNGCNLACKGCDHNSPYLAPGSSVNVDMMIKDIETVLPRINVWSHISVLGGEALLEPRCEEILTAIEKNYDGRIKLYSNSTLLYANREWIIKHMNKGVKLYVSLHIKPLSTKGKILYRNLEQFIEYAKDKTDLEENLHVSETWDELWFDKVKQEGNKIYPYNDNNINDSWKYCTCPNPQLYAGMIWKCPIIAYLRETISSTGQLDDPAWEPYLQYLGTPIDAPIEDLFEIADKTLMPHKMCNMCPANPNWTARSQLKDVKNKVGQFVYE